MDFLAVAVLLICMVRLGMSTRTLQQIDPNVINVLQFGAVGDGIKDDSKAFLDAWTAACGCSSGSPTLTIPGQKTYLLNPLEFVGPCKSSTINVQIIGTLVAPDSTTSSAPRWIMFSQIDGLIVNGNGVIDGRGSNWWSTYNEDPQKRPTALAFMSCNNLELHSLRHINSPRNHISIIQCNTANISNLKIDAPSDSPNTDGINISHSTNIQVHDCIIATGDDCIAINGGCSNLIITNIGCGPGHGISIGSLGVNGGTDTVEEVHVRSSSFYKTDCGARIKTWQGGQGYARHISFEDITLIEAKHPIIIDQFYCDEHGSYSCKNQTGAVQVSDITYDGFHGTSASENAIQLSCNGEYGCVGITLSNLNITLVNPTEGVQSSCTNAHGKYIGPNTVPNCLLP